MWRNNYGIIKPLEEIFILVDWEFPRTIKYRKYSANIKFSNLQFFEIFLECSRFHTPRNSSKTKFTPSFSLFLRVTKTSLIVYFADIASFSLCTLQSVGWIFQISVLINVLDIFLLMVKACDLYLKIT